MSDDRRRTYEIDGGDDMLGYLFGGGGYIYDIENDEMIYTGSSSCCRGKSLLTPINISNCYVVYESSVSSYIIPNSTSLLTLADTHDIRYNFTYNVRKGEVSSWWRTSGSKNIYDVSTKTMYELVVPVYEDAKTGFKFTIIGHASYSTDTDCNFCIYQVNDSMEITSCLASNIGINVYSSGSYTYKTDIIAVFDGWAYIQPSPGSVSCPLFRYNYMTGGSLSSVANGAYFKTDGDIVGGVVLS